MDFTREPIIETVITPREGFRLVVRSSKGAGSEEHFVDALEVVSFGSSVFFRCLERPKPFIVPVADYEVLEVREPRMVLKTSGEHNRAPAQKLKIESHRVEPVAQEADKATGVASQEQKPEARPGEKTEPRGERGRRDRRRGFRRRRGQGRDEAAQDGMQDPMQAGQEDRIAGDAVTVDELVVGAEVRVEAGEEESKILSSTPMLSTILPPPTTLIRDDLQRLREQEPYKGVFFIREDKEGRDDDDDANDSHSEEELSFREAPFDISEEEIRMSEGGDVEVSQEEPFCPPVFGQEANHGSAQDAQKDNG